MKFLGIVKPLCIQLFKRRWYVLCEVRESRKRIFSLDRIKSLSVTDSNFIYP
ncbi:MAG: WYL domain-containing protein [Bacteroidales bacterium]|nr:WYL domain-containing protein [Bacteroidales bacterium]